MKSHAIRSAAALALIWLLALSPSHAEDYRAGDLQIIDPWSRVTPSSAKVAAGYLQIRNSGGVPDKLVGGSFEGSKRFEIHMMKMEQGVMKMRELREGLTVEPGGTVELKPGSFHLMFVDLARGLQQGERVKGTLQFEKAGKVEVEFAVRGMGAKPADSHPGH